MFSELYFVVKFFIPYILRPNVNIVYIHVNTITILFKFFRIAYVPLHSFLDFTYCCTPKCTGHHMCLRFVLSYITSCLFIQQLCNNENITVTSFAESFHLKVPVKKSSCRLWEILFVKTEDRTVMQGLIIVNSSTGVCGHSLVIFVNLTTTNFIIVWPTKCCLCYTMDAVNFMLHTPVISIMPGIQSHS